MNRVCVCVCVCVYVFAYTRDSSGCCGAELSSWCNSSTVRGCSEMTGLFSPRGGWVGPGMAGHPSVLIRCCPLLCVARMEQGWETCLRLSVELVAFCMLEKWKTGLKAPLAERASYSSKP